MLPDEWLRIKLGELGNLRSGMGFPPHLQGAASGEIPFYKVSDMNLRGNESYMKNANNWVIESDFGESPIPAGSIVFAKVGAAIFLERKRILTRPSYIDNNMMAFMPGKDKCHTQFLYYLLQTVRFGDIACVTALPSINAQEVSMISISLPPLEEQRAIAEVLSDADAYVESLDALIEKKKNIKQAVMQELLTGKTRLQGFDDEWIWLPLGDVVSHKAGNGSLIKGKLFSSPAQGKAKGFSASGQDVWCDEAEYGGDGLVVSAVGSRCGKVFRASGEWTAIANTHVLLPKKGKCDADFIWFIINDEDFWKKGGSGQPFVLMKDSLNQKIKIPAFEEQQAIAEILSDIDAEIDALIAQRDKAELIKQGMMQELLSGRTRLV
jgi:type I restriction enzyme S subunit